MRQIYWRFCCRRQGDSALLFLCCAEHMSQAARQAAAANPWCTLPLLACNACKVPFNMCYQGRVTRCQQTRTHSRLPHHTATQAHWHALLARISDCHKSSRRLKTRSQMDPLPKDTHPTQEATVGRLWVRSSLTPLCPQNRSTCCPGSIHTGKALSATRQNKALNTRTHTQRVNTPHPPNQYLVRVEQHKTVLQPLLLLLPPLRSSLPQSSCMSSPSPPSSLAGLSPPPAAPPAPDAPAPAAPAAGLRWGSGGE
jgi:hypothetical protein